jgi:hypothetical protein
LRRTPNRADTGRRDELLLCDRVAAVRTELVEIAALLERAVCPDPAAVTELQRLLGSGCDSPLYNPQIHESELRAALYYAHRALLDPQPHPACNPQAPR